MGYPISHSRSPVIHRLFALQTHESIQYELLQVSPENLETAVRQFQRTGGKGLNITVPHKAEVAKLVDQMSERAATAGAVNTLAFRDGQIYGDNTDGIGLLRDLAVNLGISIEGASILILGAGGATRGIVGPLLEMQPKSLRIANRSLGKAQALADRFSDAGPVSACRFNMVPVTEPYDLIINATSAGVKGEAPPYPSAAISEQTICYDLSYGLSPTPFSVWARESGAAKSVISAFGRVNPAPQSRSWAGACW
jgi:shikimate dehydrogenase